MNTTPPTVIPIKINDEKTATQYISVDGKNKTYNFVRGQILLVDIEDAPVILAMSYKVRPCCRGEEYTVNLFVKGD